MSIVTNITLDSLNKTASIHVVGANGTAFFSFGNDEFFLAERLQALVPGDVVARIVIDFLRWFLLVMEEIGFDDFGTQSAATVESARIVGTGIAFERKVGGGTIFEGAYNTNTEILTLEPREEFTLNSADFAAFLMFLTNMAKKVGVPETNLSSLMLLETRIRSFIPFPVI